MLVRDLGSQWQVVLQPEHADLCGDFARGWAESTPRHPSLTLAAERHDDGWAVWEQSPLVDREGVPVNFLDVQVPSHLAFYRACIAAVSAEDPYAGLLVSMHGAGIYRGRYGTDPGLKLTHADEVRHLVEEFVAEQESGFGERMTAAGVDDERRWDDYRLLQVYDRLSLYFCLRDLEGGEAAEVAGYTLQPVGPWRVRIDPYPFAEEPAHFVLRRRLVPKQLWSQDEFRAAFPAIAPIDTAIELAR
jgi:hypothetical protein